MKPTLVAAIMLAAIINFAPRSEAHQRPSSEKERIQHDTYPDRQGSTSPNNQESATAKTEPAKNQSPHCYPAPEWVLVIVGLVTCIFIGWQSCATSRAAEATEIAAKAAKDNAEALINSERAWILVGNPSANSNSEGFSVELVIKNHGKTTARVGKIAVEKASQPLPAEPDYSTTKAFELILPPRARFHIPPGLSFTLITNSEIADNKTPIYVYGFVEYSDGVSFTPRTTRFLWFYNALTRSFLWVDAPKSYTKCT